MTAAPPTAADHGPGVYAGLDLGTSGLKGVLVTAAGTVVGRAHAPYPTDRPAPGTSEQDPADWLTAVVDVVGALLAQAPARRWRAIGLSAMLPTLVLCGPDGEPTGPAITWEDARAEEVGAAIRDAEGGDALYARTGQWLDGRYLLPMALRAGAADRPGTTVLGAKDLLFRRLTGATLTDPSTAAGYGCYDLTAGTWIAALARRLPAGALPDVAPATTVRPLLASVAGRLGLPAGLPVCLGAADSVLGALGLGLRLPGATAYVAGTSNVILGVAAELRPDPGHRYLVTPLAGIDGWGLEMDLLATGSSLRWLAGLLGDGDVGALVASADAVDPDDAPLVLPYLAPGEQGALWDPTLTGVLAGLHLGHGRAHLARGLLSGIVLESRRCLDVLAQATGTAGPLDVAGASTSSPGFCAELADASRRPVRRRDQSQTDMSATGAAVLAALAADGVPLPPTGPDGVAVRPDETRARRWDRRWVRHEAARLATTSLGRPGTPG